MMSVSPLPAPAGSSKLTGTVIGTPGSYKNQGNTAAKSTDADTTTYFDAASATGAWVGLDLGTAETITQVQYVPRSAYASRMIGGIFQGSNTADFSSGVTNLFSVTQSPSTTAYTTGAVSNPAAFRYVRYFSPANSYGNVAELEFDGFVQVPTAVPNAPSTPVATVTYAGVHLSWASDPTSLISSYTIQRQGPTDAGFTTVGTTLGNVTAFDDTTVSASTAYMYTVVANNSLGSSPAALPVVATTLAPFINPWTNLDIGAPAKAGSAIVNPAGPITVTGGGADIWNSTDAFNYEYQSLVGNGTITTQVTSETNTNGWAKSGIMIRESLTSESRFVMLALTPGYGVTMQSRTATHTTPSYLVNVAAKANIWLQLQRNGSSFSGYMSTDGVTWKLVGTVNLSMVNNVTAGLCVTAHDNTKACTATFSSTAISVANVEASAWTNAATAPMNRWESETFSYGNKLYAFGGYIDRSMDATSECDVYDPATNTWSYLTTVPTGTLTHASVTVLGDTVYLAGGDCGAINGAQTTGATSQVLSYNLITNTWDSTTSLPAMQSCGGLAAINNHLYYYGGINADHTKDLTATWGLDLANPSAGWVSEAAMPNGRNHIGVAVINGLAYAVGGMHLYNATRGNVAEVDAYNPLTNSWTTVAALPQPWGSIQTTTFVANNKIVIVGGQTNGGYDGIYQSAIEAYDPNSNIWSLVAILPEANEGQSAAYINGSLIVADGTVDNMGGWSQSGTLVNSEIQF